MFSGLSVKYDSCVSDKGWALIEPLFDMWGYTDKGRIHSRREIVSAIFYIVDNGTKWRSLPNDFPPWKTVYHHFTLWSRDGLWQKINSILVESVRYSQGRDEEPSLVSLDSQSQCGEPGIQGRGLDANKKRNGRKRHIAVDCLGLLLICICTPANEPDCRAGQEIVEELNDQDNFPRLQKILADNAYKGVGHGLRVPASIEASVRNDGQRGFVPEAFRWAVERTFAWLNRQRRLVRNYEKITLHQEAMNYIGNIRICLKKLVKWL